MKYRSGYKYQLAEDEVFKTNIKPSQDIHTRFISLLRDGTLTISAGYAWDGASGPTIDSKSSMRGSLFHDAIYQLIRMCWLPQSYRNLADVEFGRLLKEDGMWWWRRKLWVRELRNFGASAADPKNRKPVLEAP